jgi:hypothetical protein
MENSPKPLLWLKKKVKIPPFTQTARIEVGLLLRKLQEGKNIELPPL